MSLSSMKGRRQFLGEFTLRTVVSTCFFGVGVDQPQRKVETSRNPGDETRYFGLTHDINETYIM